MLEEVILFQIDQTNKIAKLFSQRDFARLNMGITVEQWILLKIVEENEGLTQKALADKSHRDPASITRTLDLLHKKGFLERRLVPNSRREYHIYLLEKGVRFIKKYMSVIQNQRNKSIEGISSAELKTLSEVLAKIQNNLK